MLALRLQKVHTTLHLHVWRALGTCRGKSCPRHQVFTQFGVYADYGFILGNAIEPHVNGLFR